MKASSEPLPVDRLHSPFAGREWRSLISLDALATFMDAHHLGSGPIEDVVQLAGGTQNILIRFRRAGRTFVLRRPPANPHGDGSRTMQREVQVLGALAGTDVPHPGLIASCMDPLVLGASFYLMEPVDGFVAPGGLPALHGGSAAIRHAMGLAAVRAAGALARVDHGAVGLDGLGRAEGFHARQAPRWLSQLDGYAAYEGWAGRADLPGIEAIARWLSGNLPDRPRPGLMHGDFHLGNVMFAPSGPEVAAIIDWELATVGDPLVDLGTLLCTWADPDGSHPGPIDVTPWEGFPSEPELVAHYRAASGRDVADVDWYVVLACFKLAILLEGTSARAAVGKADPVMGRSMHTASIKLLERALGRI